MTTANTLATTPQRTKQSPIKYGSELFAKHREQELVATWLKRLNAAAEQIFSSPSFLAIGSEPLSDPLKVGTELLDPDLVLVTFLLQHHELPLFLSGTTVRTLIARAAQTSPMPLRSALSNEELTIFCYLLAKTLLLLNQNNTTPCYLSSLRVFSSADNASLPLDLAPTFSSFLEQNYQFAQLNWSPFGSCLTALPSVLCEQIALQAKHQPISNSYLSTLKGYAWPFSLSLALRMESLWTFAQLEPGSVLSWPLGNKANKVSPHEVLLFNGKHSLALTLRHQEN